MPLICPFYKCVRVLYLILLADWTRPSMKVSSTPF